MERVKEKNYNGACTRFQEFTHQCPEETLNTVSHPNGYFEESRRLHKVQLEGSIKQQPKREMAIPNISIKQEYGI